jgi:hypothetical protein
VRRARLVPAGDLLTVLVPAGCKAADLDSGAEPLAAALAVRELRVVRDRGNAQLASVLVVRRDPFAAPEGLSPGAGASVPAGERAGRSEPGAGAGAGRAAGGVPGANWAGRGRVGDATRLHGRTSSGWCGDQLAAGSQRPVLVRGGRQVQEVLRTVWTVMKFLSWRADRVTEFPTLGGRAGRAGALHRSRACFLHQCGSATQRRLAVGVGEQVFPIVAAGLETHQLT